MFIDSLKNEERQHYKGSINKFHSFLGKANKNKYHTKIVFYLNINSFR